MTIKINRDFLPIKAHYFLFFAALGPILPQLNVFGKQLGVSPAVMGLVTAILPLLWAVAKPTFGYAVDYFTNQRKIIFMSLIMLMTASYCCLWFLPSAEIKPPEQNKIVKYEYRLNNTVYIKHIDNTKDKSVLTKYTCNWNCRNKANMVMWLTENPYINTIYVNNTINNDTCEQFNMKFNNIVEDEDIVCEPIEKCNLICTEFDLNLDQNKIKDIVDSIINNRSKRYINNFTKNEFIDVNETKADVTINEDFKTINSTLDDSITLTYNKTLENNFDSLTKSTLGPSVDRSEMKNGEGSFYVTPTFWGYVILMCLGTVAFNVANCISDAVCFDVLGPTRGNKYGYQRAWGTAGYGITALVGGFLVDMVSTDAVKDFTPAFVLALIFTVFDIIACRKLKLPQLSSPKDAGRALRDVLRMPRVVVFIVFAMIVGIFDSFIIYYMFWYLEELAEITGHMDRIKLIEGVIVAAQSFVGELLFFFFSGKIIKRWGHSVTMTFCLFCYGIRLALISFISHPWHLVFIEAIMQGPTYALCYATIVGYAAEVAPEGYSATVQGIVAGMDDGVGFAIGSLVGGLMYSYLGGCNSFKLMALIGLFASLAHALLHKLFTFKQLPKESQVSKTDGDPHEIDYMLQKHDDYGTNDHSPDLNENSDKQYIPVANEER